MTDVTSYSGPNCPNCGNSHVIENTALGAKGQHVYRCDECGCRFDIYPTKPNEQGLVVEDWEWCGEDGKDLRVYYTNGQVWTYTNVEVRPQGFTHHPSASQPIVQDFQFSYVSREKES